jgi:hypothetical protein
MRIHFFLTIFLLIAGAANAQVTIQQSIEESEPGWYKVYNYKGAKESKKVDDRVFSITQLSLCDSFINWIQASYIPKAGIGDVKARIFPKASLYSPYNVAWPQGYGAVAYIWSVTYNSKGKLERIPETENVWAVEANYMPGWSIPDLSTATHYYFTMPSYEGHEKLFQEQDLSKVTSLKPYISFWVKSPEAGGGMECVLLCRDNHSPFIKITKGEYLQLLETAIPNAYQKEKKSIYEKNSGDQKGIDYFMKYLDEKNIKRMVCLKNNKEKYKNRLAETAETFAAQPDIMLENYPDVFEGNGGSAFKYPVYTIDPAMFELCKKDRPQWIMVRWIWGPSSTKEKYMHESIINNFNFDYVYNFFFDPEKVKGMPYKPKHSPLEKESVVETEKSETGKKIVLDKNVHFFEDFSTTVVGKNPIGWYATASGQGVRPSVATIDGTENKWAMLKGNSLLPNNLKKPMPQNFTISYDVIVPENFTWGGKGLVFWLAKEKSEGVNESFIRLRIRPGYGGSAGQGELETQFPSGYANGTKSFEVIGFSNNKKINRVHVTIKKNGEGLQLLLDKTMTAEYIKCMPGDILFNALSFEMASSDGENEKYYISNIKITKD